MPVVLGAASAITSRRVALYGLASTAAALAVVVNSFRQRPNFYSASVMLGGSNGCKMVLFNFGVFLALCFGVVCQKLFFGPLRAVELEHLHERLWYSITESLLAMTIFRDDFDSSFALLFGTLLFLKVFHWLCADRVEFMEQSPSVGRLFHVRMVAVLSILFEIDLFLATFAVEVLIIDQNRKGIMIMFASEFFILSATLWSTIAKYLINCQDLRSEEPWQAKSMYVFVVDLVTDFLKLATYLAGFCLILSYYGLPLHIFRDVYMTGRSFFGRLRDFVKYRAATRNMDTRFPNASSADLRGMSDVTCIICREEMIANDDDQTSGPQEASPGSEQTPTRESPRLTTPQHPSGLNETPKKLPCGHIFHFHCLRSWLERQQSCPTCRRTVFVQAEGDNLQPGFGRAEDVAQNNPNPDAGGHAGEAFAGQRQRDRNEGTRPEPTTTQTARDRLQSFLQQLQSDAQRVREESQANVQAHLQSQRSGPSTGSTPRNAANGGTSSRTDGEVDRQARDRSSGSPSATPFDASRSQARKMLINSLFAHQDPVLQRRREATGETYNSALPPAPVLQGLRPSAGSDEDDRNNGHHGLHASWMPPAPWTFRRYEASPDGARNEPTPSTSANREPSISTKTNDQTSESRDEGETDEGEQKSSPEGEATEGASLEPQDAREAARAAALRRFETHRSGTSSKAEPPTTHKATEPDQTKNAQNPTQASAPTLPGDPHLIPLFNVASIEDFEAHHARRLTLPLLRSAGHGDGNVLRTIETNDRSQQLASLALSAADLEGLSRQTRKGLEERLRLLYRVEGAVGQLVEELTRALSVIPPDDALADTEQASASDHVHENRNDKGKEPAEGIRSKHL